jgi:hypothetical protein
MIGEVAMKMKYNVQVLISTMNQTPNTITELIDKMNIASDAVVGNQCDKDEIWQFEINGCYIEVLSSSERGLSKNRNKEIREAQADICVIADDDMCFNPGYVDTLVSLYSRYKNADLIVFNIGEQKQTRYITKKIKKLNPLSCLKYSGARITFKRTSIIRKGIMFDTRFGSGSKYISGEDNLFLSQCIKSGLRAIAVPEQIAMLRECRDSTWYKGMNDDYFYSRGAFFFTFSRFFYVIFIVRFAIKNRQKFKNEMTVGKSIRLMLKGAHSIRRNKDKDEKDVKI